MTKSNPDIRDCIQLCEEFTLGESSDMFIGKLDQYEKFIENMEEILREFDPSIRVDQDDLHIDTEIKYNQKFFISSESTNPELSHLDLGNHVTKVEGSGFDLYKFSLNSNYKINDDFENLVEKNIGETSEDDITSFNAHTTKSQLNDTRLQEEFDRKHEDEKLEELDNLPKKTVLNSLSQTIMIKEQQMEKSIANSGTLGVNNYDSEGFFSNQFDDNKLKDFL